MYDGITSIYSWQDVPRAVDFILISNPTSEHFSSITEAVKLKLPLMIEKPALASLSGAEKLAKQLALENIISYVAFPLRFNPVFVPFFTPST